MKLAYKPEHTNFSNIIEAIGNHNKNAVHFNYTLLYKVAYSVLFLLIKSFFFLNSCYICNCDLLNPR